MFFSKRRNHKSQPVLDESLAVNNRQQVLETLQALRLPPEKLIITGSAAITLLGLERQAHDLDIMAHPDILNELKATDAVSGFAAGEATFSRPDRPHFNVASSPLPSEIFRHDEAEREFDEYFERRAIQTSDGIFITRPRDILLSKGRGFRVGANRAIKLAQDDYDIQLLERYLSEPKKR